MSIVVADSPSYADVLAALDECVDEDTLSIPAGTATWSTSLVIEKAITMQGAGVGQTIIRDGMTDGTPLMNWTMVATKTSRMTGIEFNDNGRLVQPYIINFFGSNTNGSQVRVDHCKFDHLNGFALHPNNCIGVFDHNEFLFAPTNIPIYAFDKEWGGGQYSNESWHDACGFGSANFLFIETNEFISDGPYLGFDCFGGARVVFRYNDLTNCAFEVHGTDSGQIFRGGRAFEVYNNTFSGDVPGGYIVNGRSGTFVIHNNVVNDCPGALFRLNYYRSFYPFSPWGAMDGYNEWDDNDPSNPIEELVASSGTPSGGVSGYPTVTVNGETWTPNQWQGYVIKKTSAESATQKSSLIVENTDDTITYIPAEFELENMEFSNGDTFEINLVLHGIDQPGWGQGSLISATDPPEPPVGWNDQVNELSYQWDNDSGEESPEFVGVGGFIVEGDNYINGTPMPGYTPYQYPYPLVADITPSLPGNPSTSAMAGMM
jgi:hypothetical protein